MTKRCESMKDVVNVINMYIEGTRTGNTDMIRKSFHPDALMSGYMGPKCLIGDITPFTNHVETSGKPATPPYQGHMISLDITGNIASAKVVEDDLYGMDFVNFFHLMSVDGEWKIVSKLFRHD